MVDRLTDTENKDSERATMAENFRTFSSREAKPKSTCVESTSKYHEPCEPFSFLFSLFSFHFFVSVLKNYCFQYQYTVRLGGVLLFVIISSVWSSETYTNEW